MRRYEEDEYLMLSGIQHFVFCKRQWALIHIEQQWAENYRTVDGSIVHKRVHDRNQREKRGDIITVRGMAVSSAYLGISGECDAVEFRRSPKGVSLFGREETYTVTPIEYKRGTPKINDCDKMQLAAQVMCLEEMLVCEIPVAYLYYKETGHRLEVEIDTTLRQKTEETIMQMHEYYQRAVTPKGKRTKACNACSLKDLCLPVLLNRKKASDYVERMLAEEENEKIT